MMYTTQSLPVTKFVSQVLFWGAAWQVRSYSVLVSCIIHSAFQS